MLESATRWVSFVFLEKLEGHEPQRVFAWQVVLVCYKGHHSLEIYKVAFSRLLVIGSDPIIHFANESSGLQFHESLKLITNQSIPPSRSQTKRAYYAI